MIESVSMKNMAFIDGQNLYLGTTKCNDCSEKYNISIKEIKLSDCKCGKAWKINLEKFRIYLKENYGVEKAYYFLGYPGEENDNIYKHIQEVGFIISFREHHKFSKSAKKGNVDTEIVFEVMKNVVDNNFDKIVLVSGDGDYKKLVQYLIHKNKFTKILFPNRRFASSLYNSIGSEFFDYLENIKKYIA